MAIVQEAQYFSASELMCKCDYDDCPKYGVQEEAAAFIDRVRELVGRPVILNCAYRCLRHNADQEGSAENSAHVMGAAFDIRAVSGREKYEIIIAILDAGCSRFGVYNTFIHADIGDQMTNHVNAEGEPITASDPQVVWKA